MVNGFKTILVFTTLFSIFRQFFLFIFSYFPPTKQSFPQLYPLHNAIQLDLSCSISFQNQLLELPSNIFIFMILFQKGLKAIRFPSNQESNPILSCWKGPFNSLSKVISMHRFILLPLDHSLSCENLHFYMLVIKYSTQSISLNFMEISLVRIFSFQK